MMQRRALLDAHRLTERQSKSFSLLELLRRRGPLTRTELSQGTTFNIVTVSNYVAEFIRQGLVVERGFDVSTGGRKPVLVELNAKASFAVGVDLGVMSQSEVAFCGVITDLQGTVVHRMVTPRPAQGMEQILEQARGFLRQLISTSPIDAKKLCGAAIGVGGIVDERAGTVRDTSHRGIRTSFLALRDRWEAEFKIPVIVGNDATLAGYGEYRLGLDRTVDNLLYCYSDMGLSLVINGHVYWGSGGSAGELGVFVPSEQDYLSWINSSPFIVSNVWDLGVVAQARKLAKEGHTTVLADLAQGNADAIRLDTVLEAAQQGDQLSIELVEHAATQLGIRIASLVNLLNPEVVVIGGGIERGGALVLEPIWRAVQKYAYEEPANLVDVLPGKLGQNAVALGAACWVIQEVFTQA